MTKISSLQLIEKETGFLTLNEFESLCSFKGMQGWVKDLRYANDLLIIGRGESKLKFPSSVLEKTSNFVTCWINDYPVELIENEYKHNSIIDNVCIWSGFHFKDGKFQERVFGKNAKGLYWKNLPDLKKLKSFDKLALQCTFGVYLSYFLMKGKRIFVHGADFKYSRRNFGAEIESLLHIANKFPEMRNKIIFDHKPNGIIDSKFPFEILK